MATTSLAVSTRIWNVLAATVIGFYQFWVFIIAGNPLTMWVLFLFSPKLAHRWANNDTYFGDTPRKMYRYLALKWPFYWSKWWINLSDLPKLSVCQQLGYFFEVNPLAETFNAMSEEAGLRLLDCHPAVCLHIVCFMRFKTKQFAALLNDGKIDLLAEYLRHGALSAERQKMLAEAALNAGTDTHLYKVFEDYVKRYNLLEALQIELNIRYPQQFETVKRAVNCYHQRRTVLFCAKMDCAQSTKWWKNFCRTTSEIYPEVQAEMNSKQYEYFHEYEHTLAPEAICKLLKSSDSAWPRLIFKYEPAHGLVSKEIRLLVAQNKGLSKILDECCAE